MNPVKRSIRTLRQARAFVLKEGLCGIFSDGAGTMRCLWDVVDLPDRTPGEKGWGEKVTTIWRWKNELPATFPTEIFYGKIKGGRAVLMSMDYLRTRHYPAHHIPIDSCSELAQTIYRAIKLDPTATTPLRKQLGMSGKAMRNRFDRALVELQVTLNIARLNTPGLDTDTWVAFSEQHLEAMTT